MYWHNILIYTFLGQSEKILDTIIKDEIIRNCSAYEFNVNILTAEESPPLYIFFDGLDELSSDEVRLAMTCFVRIKVKFSRARLHVTTRPHLMRLLEQKLGTLGYNIDPFTLEDQVKFLTNQWSNIRYEPKLDFEKLKSFAEHCLSALQISISKNERSIAGVPLQCLLISEVFAEEAEEFADPENQQIAKTVKPTVHVKSITQLYETLITRKFKTFHKIHLESESTSNVMKSLRNIHIYISVKAIMLGSNWAKNIRSIILTSKTYSRLKLFLPKWEATLVEFQAGCLPRQDILAIGILEETDSGNWQFMHRTFAEYFIANFTADYFRCDLSLREHFVTIMKFITHGVLETVRCTIVLSPKLNFQQDSFKFKYPVVCHFLNTMVTPETNL